MATITAVFTIDLVAEMLDVAYIAEIAMTDMDSEHGHLRISITAFTQEGIDHLEELSTTGKPGRPQALSNLSLEVNGRPFIACGGFNQWVR